MGCYHPNVDKLDRALLKLELARQAVDDCKVEVGDVVREMAIAPGERRPKEETAARVGVTRQYLRLIEAGKKWVKDVPPDGE